MSPFIGTMSSVSEMLEPATNHGGWAEARVGA
jgi:hypothetical protein